MLGMILVCELDKIMILNIAIFMEGGGAQKQQASHTRILQYAAILFNCLCLLYLIYLG